MKKRVLFVLISMMTVLVTALMQPDLWADNLREKMIAKAKLEGALVIAGNIVNDIKGSLKLRKTLWVFSRITSRLKSAKSPNGPSTAAVESKT